ncbi:uncharacterized protein LOC118465485 [Anopheles albimanus]|uniref:uncharacterized protein LOC118465485 n=1 Tax=Anopheles albimanus TaxID=7167 RepID=UPI00163EFA95|nr:uncharacterized protein LOC118465485 [Anopheles albimanus]
MTGYVTIFMHTNESTKINHLRVSEGDHQTLFEMIYELERASDMFFKVKLLTCVKFNRLIKLMVSCSLPMAILLYYVISKGNIVETEFFKPHQMSRYVFRILMNNEMFLDAITMCINGLGSPLDIMIEEHIGKDGIDLGDEIELAIRGRPGAFVALTAYDQRFL